MKEEIAVVLAGLPEEEAILIAEGLLNSEKFSIFPENISSERGEIELEGFWVGYFPEEFHREIIELNMPDVIVDFTEPESFKNMELYCEKEVPFVVKTNNKNIRKIEEKVEKSNISAMAILDFNIHEKEIYIQDVLTSIEVLLSAKERGKLFSISFL